MEITDISKLNQRCQQVVKAIDAYAVGCEKAFKNEVSEISIRPDDYVSISISLGLTREDVISRKGIKLIPAPKGTLS